MTEKSLEWSLLILRIVLSRKDAFEEDFSESPTLGRGKKALEMDNMMMMRNANCKKPDQIASLSRSALFVETFMSRVVRKLAFCLCKNKDADQLCGNREADQRLCFCYTDSQIPLLPSSEILSL